MPNNYKLVLHKDRLEAFCADNAIPTVPEAYIVSNIPSINYEGREPLGDYQCYPLAHEMSQIRVRNTLRHCLDRLPKTLTDRKRRKLTASMNEVLYHELRHHIQATTMQAFYIEGRKGDYNKRPIERDARSFARRQMRSRQAFKAPIIELIKEG